MKTTSKSETHDISMVRRWYREPSLWISIFALIASTSYSIYSILNHQHEEKETKLRAKLDLLRQTVISMMDMRLEMTRQHEADSVSVAKGPLRVKWLLYSESARSLVSELDVHLSAELLFALGDELYMESDPIGALPYLKASLFAPLSDDLSRVFALSDIGDIYYRQMRDTVLARKHFSLAFQQAEKTRNDTLNYHIIRANLYQEQFMGEFANINNDSFLGGYDRAKSYISLEIKEAEAVEEYKKRHQWELEMQDSNFMDARRAKDHLLRMGIF